MRTRAGVVSLVLSLIIGSAAHAITVRVVEDEVFVGNYNGYNRVSGTAQGKVGDSVMAGEFGVGQIIYANGCVVTVRPGAVVPIVTNPSCETSVKGSTNPDPAHKAISTQHILVGTAVAGGIGAGIYFLTKSSGDDKPASP